jgi:hopene-associated glycosyltransferase HpnB
MSLALAILAAIIWATLLFGRGFFWLMRARDESGPMLPAPAHWPDVVAVIPARDEAETIGAVIASLGRQDYRGSLSILLVDDGSADGTAAVARAAGGDRLVVLAARPLAAGWTGKVAALAQGVAEIESRPSKPKYLWLTDADIAYAPDTLSLLVARAERDGLALTSLMAELKCVSAAERWLIPAFVFFFAMLYPFPWVNRPRDSVAAAAGGCMLIRREALGAVGGMASICDALIDDCALGARLKTQGPIWLGISHRAVSLRGYATLADFARMVARSAYAQLRFSPLWLAGAVLGLALTYLAPPLLAVFGSGPARWIGLATWIGMAVAFAPIATFYKRPSLSGIALPVIAALYMAFTVFSAYEHRRGRGGMWKGRAQAIPKGRA